MLSSRLKSRALAGRIAPMMAALGMASAGLVVPAVAQASDHTGAARWTHGGLGVRVADNAAPQNSNGQTNGAAPDAGSSSSIEEIVVTATRQSQVLNHVPISIVAKNQAELDKEGVRSMDDLARMTPGITFGQNSLYYGTGQSNISIRGVSSASGIPTTGVYIDDTPIQTRLGVSPDLTNPYPEVFDLDRIEVLRGPQGTLFGSGSVGGAVRFITPAPSLSEMSIYGRSEVSTTEDGAPSYESGLAGGAPIVEDKLGFRASVWYRHDGGYIDRLDPYTHAVVKKDTNSQDSFSSRVALGWKVTNDLTITPSLFFQNVRIDDGSRFSVAASDLSKERFNNDLNITPEIHRDTFYLPAVKVEWNLGSMSLYSDTSYFARKTTTQSDDATLAYSLWPSPPYVGPAFPAGFEGNNPGTRAHSKQWAFTQEIRLQNNDPNDRFNWVTGFFYQNSMVNDYFKGYDPNMLAEINITASPPYASVADYFGTDLYQGIYSVVQNNTHRDVQKALYAQVDYEILPKLKLTTGLRYTMADYRFNGFIAGPLYATDGRTDDLKTANYTFTPKFGLSYQADDRNLFYVSAAKGVRGGGVSPAVGLGCAADAAAFGFDPTKSLPVKPDSIWSYEAGSKNTLLDDRLSVDVSAYHVNWTNVQTLLALPQCQVYTTLNLGNAAIDGFDLALSVRPLRGLSFGFAASYADARYTTTVSGASARIIEKKGDPLPVAPWSIQVNGDYDYPVDDYDVYAHADFTYTSHNGTPLDLSSVAVDPAIPRAPQTELLNLRVGMRFDDARYDDIDISVFVNNVTDSHPLLGLYHDSLSSVWFRSGSFRPRTIGLTATIRR